MESERRRFPRVTQTVDARYRISGGFGESWRMLRVLDLSAVGMRAQCEEPMEMMTDLEIRIQFPGLRQPMEIHGQVVRSTALPSGVAEAGIDFLDMNPEQQLLLDELVRFLKRGDGPVPPA